MRLEGRRVGVGGGVLGKRIVCRWAAGRWVGDVDVAGGCGDPGAAVGVVIDPPAPVVVVLDDVVVLAERPQVGQRGLAAVAVLDAVVAVAVAGGPVAPG